MVTRADEFTPDDIRELLCELNDHLAGRNIKAYLLMAGGAVMTTSFGSRLTTQDIDGVFEPSTEIREVVSQIAAEHGLEEDWLNDGVKGFINPRTMGSEPYMKLSNLEVRTLDAKSMLSLKLTSARFDGGKDIPDAIALMRHLGIRTVDEAFEIVEERAYPNQMTPKAQYFIMEVFERYKAEEDARADGVGAPDSLDRGRGPGQVLDDPPEHAECRNDSDER